MYGLERFIYYYHFIVVMRRGFGIGLLLLASALLLVTLGVTLTVPGSVGILESIELLILLIIQLAILVLLFADKKWGISHFLIFIIAILGIGFAIRGYISGAESIGVLAIIAINLLGFILAVFGAAETEPVVPRRQTKLETFEQKTPKTEVYDVDEIVKKAEQKTSKKSSKRGRPKGSTKKTAKKSTAKKSTSKKSSKRGRPKGSTKKTAKKTPKKTTKKETSENKVETHF